MQIKTLIANTMETTDYRAELETVRQKAKDITKPRNDESFDIYLEGMRCCIFIAKENHDKKEREWENAALVREFLSYAEPLEGFDHLLNHIYSAVSDMKKFVLNHPRLRVRFLRFFLLVVYRIEAKCDHETSTSEYLLSEISDLERNIYYADNNKLEHISTSEHLKSDPVEWTQQWEEIIDEVDKKTYENLAGIPHGRGFCHTLWDEKTRILREEYGIEWKSPAVMNPDVKFD